MEQNNVILSYTEIFQQDINKMVESAHEQILGDVRKQLSDLVIDKKTEDCFIYHGSDSIWAELKPVTDDVKAFINFEGRCDISGLVVRQPGLSVTNEEYVQYAIILNEIKNATHFYDLYNASYINAHYNDPQYRNTTYGYAQYIQFKFILLDKYIIATKGNEHNSLIHISLLPKMIPKYVLDILCKQCTHYKFMSYGHPICFIIELIDLVKKDPIQFQTHSAPIILEYDEKTKALKEHEKNLESLYQNKHKELQKKYDDMEKRLITKSREKNENERKKLESELDVKYKCFEKYQMEANEVILTSEKELSIKQSKLTDEQKLLSLDQDELDRYKKAFNTLITPYVDFQCQLEQYNENVQKLKINKQKLQAIALKSRCDQEEIENLRKQLNLDIDTFNEEKKLFLLHSNLGLDEIEF